MGVDAGRGGGREARGTGERGKNSMNSWWWREAKNGSVDDLWKRWRRGRVE